MIAVLLSLIQDMFQIVPCATYNFGSSRPREFVMNEDLAFKRFYLKRPRIGTDEIGKGDYFGPLVVARVLIDDDIEEELKKLKVKDSKSLVGHN